MKARPWLIYTLGSCILGSIFPIIAAGAVKNTPPFVTLAITISIAAVLFLMLVLATKKTEELKNKTAWKYAFITGIFNNILFYGFFYYGLQFTNPGNAGLIALTEIGFSFIFFQIWRKETLTMHHIAGILLLVAGAVYLLLPKTHGFSHGDLIICLAMMAAPIGNFYQKKGRERVSVFSFLFMRYTTSLPLLFGIVFAFQEPISYTGIQASFIFIATMGLLSFGLKNIFWIEAIRHVTVTRMVALHGFVPMLTLLWLWVFQGVIPTPTQVLSGIPMMLGVYLLTK